MEAIQGDLTAMISHVNGLPSNPTPDQLLSKIRQLGDALVKDCSSLPKRIYEIVDENFQSHVGYNLRRRVTTNASICTVGHLVAALEEMKESVANYVPQVVVRDAELISLSAACSRLWELDSNRLMPEKDYIINVQRGKNMYDQGDVASEPLFTFIDEKALMKPTFASFSSLLDNYVAETGVTEQVTDQERAEERKFLNLIMDTAVMQYVHKYLLAKGKTKATDRNVFIQELHDIWFSLYKRKVANDSSGFEHVFVGEVKEDNNEITGFHNWIQLYLEEKRSSFDYRGFIKPKRRNNSNCGSIPDNYSQLISLQFQWRGAIKNVSSSFIGTSPEFEVALYTLCFLLGEEENIVDVGPYKVLITCHRYTYRDKVYIATAFPSEAPITEDEAATRIQSQVRTKNTQRSYGRK